MRGPSLKKVVVHLSNGEVHTLDGRRLAMEVSTDRDAEVRVLGDGKVQTSGYSVTIVGKCDGSGYRVAEEPSLTDSLGLDGDSREYTMLPYWGIVRDFKHERREMIAGIWFDRKEAERVLNDHRHQFGEDAYVYCFSGYASAHMAKLYAIAREERWESK